MEPVYNGHPWDHAKWLLYRGGLLIEVTVYKGHPWDHAEWLFYRGGLLIVYKGHHAEWLLYRGGLLIEVGRIVLISGWTLGLTLLYCLAGI